MAKNVSDDDDGKFLRGAVNFKLGPNLLSLNFEPSPWPADLIVTRKSVSHFHHDDTFPPGGNMLVGHDDDDVGEDGSWVSAPTI